LIEQVDRFLPILLQHVRFQHGRRVDTSWTSHKGSSSSFVRVIFRHRDAVAHATSLLVLQESKQWTTDSEVGGINEMARDRNRLCIEDPFEISYNVARTVTKDGLYTIRGEFMRASRILTSRPERAASALASLCEGESFSLVSLSPASRT
jgi:terminal uridylyltransferase